MNHENSCASDLVFARYTSSSAASGYFDSSASPSAILTILRNRTIVAKPVMEVEPKAQPMVEKPAGESRPKQ